MTVLTQSVNAIERMQRSSVFYTSASLREGSADEIGAWTDVVRRAAEEPSELCAQLGIPVAPSLLLHYSFSSNMMGYHGVVGVEMDTPASALNVRAALQNVGTTAEPRIILIRNGVTELADSVEVDASLGYDQNSFSFLAALRPTGERVRDDRPLGNPLSRKLEETLRAAVGLPRSRLIYGARTDEHGVNRQYLRNK